jgi:hypothetical protein
MHTGVPPEARVVPVKADRNPVVSTTLTTSGRLIVIALHE